jgi:anti-anti-sigma factor
MAPFSITHLGALSLIKLPARVSLAHAKSLLEAGSSELSAGRRQIVLDLRGTEALDSTVLGAVVQLHRQAAAKRATVTLLGPSEGVRRVLAITRLDGVLPIRASISEIDASREGSST